MRGAQILFIALSIIIVLFAAFDYPIYSGDSMYFFPASINLARGVGFINQLSPIPYLVNPDSIGEFMYYPPFSVLTLASLLPHTATPTIISYIQAGISIVVLLIFLLCVSTLLKRAGVKITFFHFICIGASLVGLSTKIIFHDGRPEVVGRLLILAVAGVLLFGRQGLWKSVVAGIGVGLLTTTQLFVGILFSCLLLIYFSFVYTTKRVVMHGALAGVAAVISTVGVLSWSPYGISKTILGIVQHGGYAFYKGNVTLEKLIWYNVINPSSTAHGVLLIAALCCSVYLLLTYKHAIKSKTFLSIGTVGFIFIGYIYCVISFHEYYLYAFTPLYYGVIFAALLILKSRALKMLLLAIVLTTGIGFVRQLAIFPEYVRDGVHLSTARSLFQKMIQTHPNTRQIAITASLWTLDEHYDRMYAYRENGPRPIQRIDLVLFQQQDTSLTHPPKVAYSEKCTLQDDYFVKKRPNLFGVPIGNSFPGYGFAVYECKN